LLTASLCALGIAACAGIVLPRPSEADLPAAQLVSPEATLATLHEGRSRYLASCAACHQAYAPASRSDVEWRHEVAEMSARAHLSSDDQRLILTYLETYARR